MPRTPQELLSDLTYAFPRHFASMTAETRAQTLRVYLRELADVPPATLEAAIRDVMRRSEFFPTVAAILAAAAERTLGMPSETEALAQVEARVRWARRDEGARGEPPAVHPAVRQALGAVGGYHAYKAAENQAVVRGQFLRLYRDLRASAIDAATIAPALPAGPQRGELTQ